MDKQVHTVGERVDKSCVACGEERGHVVSSVNKLGRISRVTCPKCGTCGTFKNGTGTTLQRSSVQSSAPYDRTVTYRTGQGMMHPTFGPGEVTALIEPRKIDVLFSDRMRRLVHAHAQR